MNIKCFFALIMIAKFSFTQEVDFDNFIKKHELKVNSDIAFKSLKNEVDELNLSFESQQWPIDQCHSIKNIFLQPEVRADRPH